ncbi:DNA replication factor C subunit Rfc2 [Catenaria anguillulae PL171]|uniref:DNA replication factor C subunit Rfc2 n=1 Tax=Catenaria anguillulae PL171 TaxID=765915 RepID=A0A1Y2HAU0_9FUNG|nr:DNA replication factor C subunit Rfc2 [Catenaria anguillulae PL171]
MSAPVHSFFLKPSRPAGALSAGNSKATGTGPTPKAPQPWVEKYRPASINDISSQAQVVQVLRRTIESQNLPHLLFYGPPGTGKTSTILALAKDLFGPDLYRSRVLELNASDERGIQVVREKIKNFARTVVSSVPANNTHPVPPYKIIVLDEADSMTPDAQAALRRVMEQYSNVTRFCLVCNYVTRIIDPLASRCAKFRFTALDPTDVLTRLRHVATSEAIRISDEALSAIMTVSEGDMRKAIMFLQSASRLEVLADGWSAAQVVTQVYDEMCVDGYLSSLHKARLAQVFGRVDQCLTGGAEEGLQVLDLVVSGCRIAGAGFGQQARR